MPDDINTPDRVVDRYVRSLTPPPATAPTHSSDDRSDALRREAASGGTVANFVFNMGKYTSKLQSLVNTGAFEEARQYYGELQDTISRNREGLLSLASVKNAGTFGDALAKQAEFAVMNGFDSAGVKAYGEDTTVGAVLGAGSTFVKDRSNLEGLGFGAKEAAMYFGRQEVVGGQPGRQFDDIDRAMMRPFVTPFAQESAKGLSAGTVKNHMQLKEMAGTVAELRDDIRSTFGDSSAALVDFVNSTHGESGGAPQALRSLLSIGKAMNHEGLNSRDVTDRVISMYSDLGASMFGDKKMDGDQRRWFDAALLSTVKAYSSNNKNVDLENPAFRRAFKEAANEFRAAFDYGIDIRADAKPVGANVNREIGDYIYRAGTGQAQKPGNIVHSLRGVRRGLNSLVVGGSDFTPEAVESLSGRRGQGTTVAGRTGGSSGCIGADAVASDAQEFLYTFATPHIIGHRDVGSALKAALSRRESNKDLRSGLADAIGASFHGKAGRVASTILADEILSGVVSGRGVNVQDTITRLAYGDPEFAKRYPSATQAFRSWVGANVLDDDIRAMRAQLVERNKANGMTEHDAQSKASVLAATLFDMKQNGGNYRAAHHSAMVTAPAYVKALARDPKTGQPVIDQRTGRPKFATDPEFRLPVITRQLINYDSATGGRFSTDAEFQRKMLAEQDGLALEYGWVLKTKQELMKKTAAADIN